MESRDETEFLCGAVSRAAEQATPLRIEGHGSKGFYGRPVEGNPLSTRGHRGIIGYEPSELTIQARSGTPLRDVEAALSEHGQALAFEPPRFGDGGTLGGAIATGLSGPARPFRGAARDFVLGVGLINGRGQALKFGGQVMKNVAGYDVSRFVTASLGTLGVIADVSLRVLPCPRAELTLVQEATREEAVGRFTDWCGRPLPLSGACWHDGKIYVRFSGVEEEMRQLQGSFGGARLDLAESWWSSVRDHHHEYFRAEGPLWRISLPAAAPGPDLPGSWFLDWAGAQRWLRTDADAGRVRSATRAAGGHATLFRGGQRGAEVFHPLPGPLLSLHRRLKEALDPAGILNPGRMYREL